MNVRCEISGQSFSIDAEEQGFYERLGVPTPELSPEERLRRRCLFRNERSLYYRTCDATEKRVVSFYAPENQFPVYEKDYWWSDQWDARDFGRPFDFERPFFEQYAELRIAVPRMNMILSHCENCDYSPYSVHSRNCYMGISCFESEDVHYSFQVHRSRDCVDCSFSDRLELAYECLHCKDSYDIRYCQNSENCTESWFLKNCIGCRNCFGCVNLKNKEYHFLNEPLGKDAYFSQLEKLNLRTPLDLARFAEQFREFSLQFPARYMYGTNNEDCTGDNVQNSRRARECFDASQLEDCTRVVCCPGNTKDSKDVQYCPNSELCYDGMSTVSNFNTQYMVHAWDVSDAQYSEECFYSSNLFGCVGLRNAEYCILNTQYSEAEYRQLKDEIIQHVKRTGEWGRFFPVELSPFAYNESLANEYFPLKKEEALQIGYRWREEDKREYKEATAPLPDSIQKTSERVCQEIFRCEKSRKNYKVQTPEFQFYKKMNLPIPIYCPDVRHLNRNKLRNPRKLRSSACDSCHQEIQTPLSSESTQDIYCETCFQQVME